MSITKTAGISPQCAQCGVRHLTIFCELSHPELESLNSSKIHRLYQRGEMVYVSGDDPAGVYCVAEGTVKIFKSGRDGKEQILRLIRPGGVFGYRALLSAQVHANSAAAIESTSLCYVPRPLFLSMASQNPAFSLKVLELISGQLRRAEERVVDLVQKSIRERLAETLLLFRESFGLERDGVTLKTKITRFEIAELVGAATESVIRQLMQFKQEGLIDMRGRRLCILKPELLLDAANVEE